VAAVTALLLSGCAGVSSGVNVPEHRLRIAEEAVARPSASFKITHLLAGATEIQPVIVDLPPLAKWPRYLRSSGPLYGLVQLSPYVGQFGAPADAGRADAGMGFGAVFGYRVPLSGAKTLGFELMYEASSHNNEASGVDANATRIVAGLRANFKMDERTVPFVVAGVGQYSLEFEGLDPKFNLSGLGVMFGGGVNISPSPRFSFRAEVALHLWDAAEESGNGGLAGTLAVMLGTAFSF
jgi:opacity protein-like surface antigen